MPETDKLAATVKIWGFMKYYHPNVADGKYDWDQELLQLLPEIQRSVSKEDLSDVFVNLIGRLGYVEACKKCHSGSGHAYFEKNFNLNWQNDTTLFSDELIGKLKYIEQNRHQGDKYYVAYKGKGLSEFVITNEKSYKSVSWQDPGYRFLALARYWNIVEYFYPYKYQMDIPWDEVLIRMIPKFQDAQTETGYHLAMLELVTSLDDSHVAFVTDAIHAFFGDKFIPAKIRYKDGKGVITGFYNDSLAQLDGLQPGDLITKVDGKDVKQKFEEYKKYIPGSNEMRKESVAAKYLFNGPGRSATIEVIRDGAVFIKTIHRYDYKELGYQKKEMPTHEMINEHTGYVNMGVLKKEDVANVMASLIHTRAIIFDLRNGANSTWPLLIDHLSSGKKKFCTIIYPGLNYPGKFIISDSFQCGTNRPAKYKGKAILLVNENTQSHAEYTAMSLQTGDHVVAIGCQTSGADGNVSIIEMVGGFKATMTGTGVFYPDMGEAQRTGVRIDITVEPTIRGLAQGSDEILGRAIEVANE